MTVTGRAMAAGAEPAPARATLHIGPLSVPIWLWLPLTIFAVTRLYGFVVISWAARNQVALPSPAHPGIYQFAAHPASPGYLALITNWDGQWYQRIATWGYHLPAPGAPGLKDALSTYAFLPLFPTVVGALMTLTGLSFAICVTIVNLLAGGAAMVVMFLLVERSAGWFVAGTAVLLTCCFVVAPLFQAAYTESIALLLVCTVLLLVSRRRYGWALVVVVLLSLTRLVTPPLAVVVIVHAVMRFRNREGDPVRRAEVVAIAVLAVASAASVSLWSTITAVITRGVKATAGSRGNVTSAVPAGRLGWFTNAYQHIGWIAVVGLGLLVVILVALALSPWTRTWGVEVRTWLAVYPTYLLFVAGVDAGMLRYLLLAFPVALLMVGSPAPGTFPHKRAALVVVASMIGLALQVPWAAHALVVTHFAGKPWLP
jgi:hypothetical protein